ncbi:MAG: family 43 glycosylhydrolase [Clostridium sp.]|uniref:family 43 glycosylhydrolase n=1 Tax=Clostridium sp. TaxID=1506 RepID=UPI003D6CA510
MNPILPINHFVPDAEAHQWEDGRMYIYGSYDISGNTSYCSHEYRVFSSLDLVNWTDHDVSFRSMGEKGEILWEGKPLYAPDCIYKNGKYYLYFCTEGNAEGVATSNSPFGPFKSAVPVQGVHMDAIDPAIFIDDDGQAYLYWGQVKARGAKLKENMSEIYPETLCTSLINEMDHGFHEGSSMRKRNGIYYLVYADISRGRPTCISYAMSKSPLGPFEKGGVIIDNTGCDPETWNNHGSIAEFGGKWYIFYHRSSQNSKFNRRVCIEPITFNEDGSIDEVEMTTQGVSGPLDQRVKMGAFRACKLSGKTYIDAGENMEYLKILNSGDWATYKYFDFKGDLCTFEATAASIHDAGEIEIRIDSEDGKVIGECAIDDTGDWKNWETFSTNVENITGVHAVYLVFKGKWSRPFNLKEFRFKI